MLHDKLRIRPRARKASISRSVQYGVAGSLGLPEPGTEWSPRALASARHSPTGSILALSPTLCSKPKTVFPPPAACHSLPWQQERSWQRRGDREINGHLQPKKGQKANDCRLERELKDIHIVIFAFLAWTPESPLGFPDQLLHWSWGSRTSELVPLCRVVSFCPGTFHSSSSTAAIPKNGQGCSPLPHRLCGLGRLLPPGRSGLCVSALSFSALLLSSLEWAFVSSQSISCLQPRGAPCSRCA